MTALLPDRGPTAATAASTPGRSAAEVRQDLRHRRPLVPSAVAAGLVAGACPLLVLLAIGVTGWFLTDAGVHGAPRDGLRVGALAWLTAHASGVQVSGTAVTVVPLGLTLLCAWSVWRVGLRLGDAVSGHGPDAARIADGERDWTVPAAGLGFTVGYLALVALVHDLAATAATAPSLSRALVLGLLLCVLVAGPAVAVGAGRASIWLALLPPPVLDTLAAARAVAVTFGWVALGCFVAALVLDLDTALNLLSQMDGDASATVLVLVVCLALVPNAAAFSGAYLLGPGFAVGALTVVSPGEVGLGALPLFPLLAALPDAGVTPAWTPWLVAVPPLVALVGAARVQHRRPTLRYDEGALRGCAGGMLAGLGFALLAALAGGSVGPGRMTDVGPFVAPVLVHALTAFGLGGLLAGLAMTWWQRRGARVLTEADPDGAAEGAA